MKIQQLRGSFMLWGLECLLLSDADVVEHSRNLFREAVPFLLLGGGADHWVFSRTLLLTGFNGLMEDAIDFPSFDPLDCLMELPEDIPSGLGCTEDSFCSREAVLELLYELSSPGGMACTNYVGFGMCCNASAQVSKEKLDELKGVHVSVKKP